MNACFELYNNYIGKRPDWNAIVSLNGETLDISLGRAGDDAAVTIPKTEYDMLMGLESAMSITTRMIGLGQTDTMSLALLSQHFKQTPKATTELLRLARGADAPRCHRPLNSYADAPEPSFRSISKSLVEQPNLVPELKRWEAISASIDHRVTDVINDIDPPVWLHRLARSFSTALVPLPFQGPP